MCRLQNGKGKPFICHCTFFEDVEKFIVAKFSADWTATKLQEKRDQLAEAMLKRDEAAKRIHNENLLLNKMDLLVGDLKMEVAIGEVVLSKIEEKHEALGR